MKKVARVLGCCTPHCLFYKRGFGSSSKYQIPDSPYYYSGKAVPRTLRSLLLTQDELSQRYSELSIPYITFQAGVDKQVDTFAALDLEEQSPSPDKTTVYCEEAWHFLIYEKDIEGITEQTAMWLKQRI